MNSSITPRSIKFEFKNKYPKYWFDNDPVKTYYGNVLAAYIPYAERFIITNVKSYKSIIKSEKLLEDVNNLLKQEGYHAREHFKYLNKVIKPHYPNLRIPTYKPLMLFLFLLMGTKKTKLSMTAAGEFFTATLSEMFLKDPSLTKGIPEELLEFWRWHFIEEIEHRSVAFDLLQEAGCGYFMRIYGFLLSCLFYLMAVGHTYIKLAKQDKRLFSIKFYFNTFVYLWIKPGLFRRSILPYARYLKPFFHPSHVKNDHLIKEWLSKSKIINEKG